MDNKNKKYDIGIIGGGIAGLSAAFHALNYGFSVVLFEKKNFGGISLNGGNILFAKMFEHLNNYLIDNSYNMNLEEIYDNVQKEKNFYLGKYLNHFTRFKEIQIVYDHAEIINKNTIVSGGVTYNVNNLILAYGARPRLPELNGIESLIEKDELILANQLLNIKEPPKKMVIYGGGRIAIEVGMFYSEIGTKVDIFAARTALAHFDDDAKWAYLNAIKNDNLNLLEYVDITNIKSNEIIYIHNGKTYKAGFDKFVVAAGFEPFFDPVKNLDLVIDDNGIVVNNNMRTNIDGVYAIGDCNNNYKYSSIAVKEAMAAVDDIMGMDIDYFKDEFITHVLGVYQYAHIGSAEKELTRQNIPYKKIVIKEEDLIKDSDDVKFVKVLFHEHTKKLLRVFIVSKRASHHLRSILTALDNTIKNEAANVFPLFTTEMYIAEKIKEEFDEYDKMLVENNFKSYYQPKVNENKKIIGVESLARFFFGDKIVNPLPFIESYETTGKIINFDLVVIENACKLLKQLKEEDLLEDDFTVSVNISPFTISVLEPSEILRLLKRYNIDQKHLVLELTERATSSEIKLLNKIYVYKDAGFKLSLDDFSVGHSSVNLFTKNDFDEVKIDMSVLPEDDESKIEIAIYNSIVSLLKTKNNDIVAEGVESDFQFEFLQQFNLNGYQGYYFYRPMSAEMLIEELKKN